MGDPPATQEGYRIHRWGGELGWESFATPEPAAHEVLVAVEACGVGLTVLNCINGDLGDDPALLPRVPGHELVGRVVAVGEAADPGLVGARVAAYFYLSCGACGSCVAGREPRCERLGGYVGVHRDGGYAPYATLPEYGAIVMPESLDPVEATVVPDAVGTPVHVAGTRAGLGPGDRVVVVGAAGGVGIHMLQLARLHGAEVVGVDRGDDKLAALEERGWRAVDGADLANLDATGLWGRGGPTAVIDLVGADATLAWSLDALAGGGRLVVLTTFRDRSLVVDPRLMVIGESSVIGSRYTSRAEVSLAAELVARGDVEPVVGGVAGPKGVGDLHDQLLDGSLLGRGALDWSRA